MDNSLRGGWLTHSHLRPVPKVDVAPRLLPRRPLVESREALKSSGRGRAGARTRGAVTDDTVEAMELERLDAAEVEAVRREDAVLAVVAAGAATRLAIDAAAEPLTAAAIGAATGSCSSPSVTEEAEEVDTLATAGATGAGAGAGGIASTTTGAAGREPKAACEAAIVAAAAPPALAPTLSLASSSCLRRVSPDRSASTCWESMEEATEEDEEEGADVSAGS